MIALGRILRTIASVPDPAEEITPLSEESCATSSRIAGEGRIVLDDQHERLVGEVVAIVLDAGARSEVGGPSHRPDRRQRQRRGDARRLASARRA